jgi:4-hydroxybenzoate polyprenyltransferase
LVALLFMALLSHGPLARCTVALVAAMLACQQAAISLHNDWCDRELDATARPRPAIPSVAESAVNVRRGAWVLVAASVGLALAINWREAGLDALGIASGFAYNAGLKRTAFSWLPFAVAFPLIPLFGPAAVDGPQRLAHLTPWVLLAGAPLAVAIHLADTVRDIETDRAFGMRGLAHRLGTRRSWCLLSALFIGGAVLLATTYRQMVG